MRLKKVLNKINKMTIQKLSNKYIPHNDDLLIP